MNLSFSKHAGKRAKDRFGDRSVLDAAIRAIAKGEARKLESGGTKDTVTYRFRHGGKLVEFVLCPEQMKIITIYPADESRRVKRPPKRGLYFGRGSSGIRSKCKGRARGPLI